MARRPPRAPGSMDDHHGGCARPTLGWGLEAIPSNPGTRNGTNYKRAAIKAKLKKSSPKASARTQGQPCRTPKGGPHMVAHGGRLIRGRGLPQDNRGRGFFCKEVDNVWNGGKILRPEWISSVQREKKVALGQRVAIMISFRSCETELCDRQDNESLHTDTQCFFFPQKDFKNVVMSWINM